MVEVLCYILGTVEKDDMRVVVRDIKGAMLSHEEFIASYERQEENTPLVMNELQQHTVAFQKHEEVTMHLNTKEASGSALLGTFIHLKLIISLMQKPIQEILHYFLHYLFLVEGEWCLAL